MSPNRHKTKRPSDCEVVQILARWVRVLDVVRGEAYVVENGAVYLSFFLSLFLSSFLFFLSFLPFFPSFLPSFLPFFPSFLPSFYSLSLRVFKRELGTFRLTRIVHPSWIGFYRQ